MTTVGHVIILGGSLAGLLSAAAVSPVAGRVTIVDRDELLVEGEQAQLSRRGVPQGDQVHHLLALGQERVEALLPGLGAELLELGCERYDDVADFSQYVNGAWRMRVASDLEVTMLRRPLFEWAIRRRVLALPNVVVVKGLAAGLIGADRVDGRDARVVGAKVRGVPGGQLVGDLVVDATGRGSRAPHWVADLGYEPPVERHVRIHVGYSTLTVRLPEGALPEGLAGLSASAVPGVPTGAAIRPCGSGLHDVVAYGMAGHNPPEDLDGLGGFFASLSSPLVAEAMKQATVTSEVVPYRMPGNQRRCWELMERRPDGFVVLGDAVTSFNPVYGQGMTMAAVGASALGNAVRGATGGDGSTLPPGATDAAQEELGGYAGTAWGMAISTDSAYPEAEFENVDRPTGRDLAWARALGASQSEEAAVRVAVRASALHLDPAYLEAPAVRRIIADWVAGERVPAAAATDPLAPPAVSAGRVRASDLLLDAVG